MIRYFTSWYNEKYEARREELITCIRKCCESESLDKIYLICEAPAPFKHEKLVEVSTERRYTFEDFFLVANGVSEPNDIIIVANTDIYPDANQRQILEQITSEDAWCLSRWDTNNNMDITHFERPDSQDVFCVRALMKKVDANFVMGWAGSDNKICYQFEQAGYKVSNPSKTVKFIHYHLTGLHNYDPAKHTVPSPYLLVQPTRLHEAGSNRILSVQPTIHNPINHKMY